MSDKQPNKADVTSDSSFHLYRRLISYALVYGNIFIVAAIGMIIVAAASTAFAAIIQPMMDGSFVERDPSTIKWVPVAIVAIFFVRVIGAYAANYGMSVIGRNVIRELRKEMFSRLLSLPKTFYDHATTGALISKFTFDVEQVANATTKAITVFIRDTLTVIGLVGWMFYLNTKLALIFIIAAPIVALIIVAVSNRFRRIGKTIQTSMGDVSRIIEESIKGQLVVKIFGGRGYEKEQFSVANEKNRKQNLRMQKIQALSSPLIQLLVACSLALIVYIATLDSMKAEVSVGTFVSFFVAMTMMMPPIRSLTSILSTLQKGIAAADSIFAFIDLKQEGDTGNFQSDTVQGMLEFNAVNFTYQGEDNSALTEINLTIKAGQTVAFVGRSGSGKTTLLNLIPRLYDVLDGEVSLDGVNIKNYELDNLRSHISYVGQDVVLFNDTIEHNIAYGSMKSYSHEDVVEAAKSSHAYEFINESNDGFQTIVGERGVKISGGQRQRIAIARALLKDSPILILDEATSALDTESERFIQASLEGLMKTRTTLVIAHRLTTIVNADVIVVMDKGKIIEKGTHQELIALNKHYAALHQMNFEEK